MVMNVSNRTSTKPVYAVADRLIFKRLRMEARQIINHLEPRRRNEIIIKAFFFPVLYCIIYAAALKWGTDVRILYGCYFMLGIWLVFVFLNIIHDAVHGTIFRKRWANRLFVHFFDLMGANSFIWEVRHIRFHHNYPNVNGWDTDIEQSKIFRVFPDGEYSPFHKYQHIYLPLLYPFYLANWLLVRDFKDFFDRKKTVRKLIHIPAVEYVKLFAFKLFFFFYILVLPKLMLGITWLQVITAFAIMLFTASLFSLIALLTPHANTESSFPVPDENNQLPGSWMMHMLLTTNDITPDNFFTRFFMGCFNYHIVHHLFPNVNHVYYPEITRLLKEYSRTYNLPYREFPLLTSLNNHYRLLRKNALEENIFEETM